MEKKCQVDDSVSFSDDLSHGLSSSTSDDKTSIQNQRDSEISAISSERFQSARQTSVRSDLSSEAGEPIHKDRKDSNTGRAEVSQEEPTKKEPSAHGQLKMLSSSSKESGVQLSPVDSVDPKPCQSSNENTASGCSHLSDGSLSVLREKDSSHMGKKADIKVDHSKGSKNGCNFDLNEGMEPIPVVAKVGVPVGQPEKPLQFGGELGWRSSVTSSAFRPTLSSKNLDRENGASCGSSRQSLASQGIDLNVAATMDSEPHEDHNSADFCSKQTERFPLDLNLRSENGEKNRQKQEASWFDLNNSPAIEDSCKKMSQIGETREMSRNYIPDSRRPSYWVDLSSMQGFNHIQSRPFLVAAPTTEQLRMVVPIQSELSFLPTTFYPPGMLPHLNNNHHPMAPVIPHLSGSVVGAYPGAIHVIDSPPQMLYPTAYATPIRPSFGQNGGIALMEDGSRGERNMEFFIPMRNALPPLSAKRREPEGGWDYSQVNYRPMASWK